MSILTDHMHATSPVNGYPPHYRTQSGEYHSKGSMQTVMTRQQLCPVACPPSNSSGNTLQEQKNRRQTTRCQNFPPDPADLQDLWLRYPLSVPVGLPDRWLPYHLSVPGACRTGGPVSPGSLWACRTCIPFRPLWACRPGGPVAPGIPFRPLGPAGPAGPRIPLLAPVGLPDRWLLYLLFGPCGLPGPGGSSFLGPCGPAGPVAPCISFCPCGPRLAPVTFGTGGYCSLMYQPSQPLLPAVSQHLLHPLPPSPLSVSRPLFHHHSPSRCLTELRPSASCWHH